MKITHLLPLALAITSTAHLATTPSNALSLFKAKASNETSPTNSTQLNAQPQAQKPNKTVLAERWAKRQARYSFTDEEVNLQSSARLYHATTPNLPPHILDITPVKPNQTNVELYALYKQSLDALAHERGKTPEEKQKEKEEREKKLAVFRIQNDCISALGHQKYCLGGVRALRNMGWVAYKKQFDARYDELREGMRMAGLVELGEKVDAWQQDQERGVREGDEKWKAWREVNGNGTGSVIDWAGWWNRTESGNGTGGDWLKNWDERRNLTRNWTSEDWLRSWEEAHKGRDLLSYPTDDATDDSTGDTTDD